MINRANKNFWNLLNQPKKKERLNLPFDIEEIEKFQEINAQKHRSNPPNKFLRQTPKLKAVSMIIKDDPKDQVYDHIDRKRKQKRHATESYAYIRGSSQNLTKISATQESCQNDTRRRHRLQSQIIPSPAVSKKSELTFQIIQNIQNHKKVSFSEDFKAYRINKPLGSKKKLDKFKLSSMVQNTSLSMNFSPNFISPETVLSGSQKPLFDFKSDKQKKRTNYMEVEQQRIREILDRKKRNEENMIMQIHENSDKDAIRKNEFFTSKRRINKYIQPSPILDRPKSRKITRIKTDEKVKSISSLHYGTRVETPAFNPYRLPSQRLEEYNNQKRLKSIDNKMLISVDPQIKILKKMKSGDNYPISKKQ